MARGTNSRLPLGVYVIESLRFTFTPNRKRQIQVENFSEWKISRKKLSRTILMYETGVKILIFLVEVISS